MNMACIEESTPAQALVACRVCLCLATTGKMYCFEAAELKMDFFNITGLEVLPDDGLPQHMCRVCRGLLRKATEFRNKCHSTHIHLSSNPVTLKFIQNIHGQPLQNTDIVSANFDSHLLDLQLDAERDTQNRLNKENTEEKDKYFQSDVQNDIQNHVNNEVKDITFQLDKENDIQNHVNKEDSESNLLNSQDDTDIKWATDDNDGDQSDDFTVDDELDSIIDKVDAETKSIPLGEIKSQEMDTLDIQFIPNDKTVKYSKMLHQYMQEKYVSKTLEPDSFISKRFEFYNFLKQKYDYDTAEEHSLSFNAKNLDAFNAKKYNLKIEYFRTTEERIDNMRARMFTDKYKQAKFKCTDCYTGFTSEQIYKKHRERHDSVEHGGFICEVCTQRYPTKEKLRDHRRYHSKKLTCNQCGQSVPDVGVGKFKEHFDSHNSGSKYECEHCPYVASKKSSLLQHVYRKHGSVPCSICYFMMSPRGVDRHMRRQHAKTFTCSSCCKVFNTHAAITRHIHTSPGGVCGADAWPCTKCGRNLCTESELREHIDRIHRRRDSNSKQHTTLHPGERPYWCSQCEKKYTSRSALHRHCKIIHENLRPYECTICSKEFPQASELRIHVNSGVHKTELPLEAQRQIEEKEEQKCNTNSNDLQLGIHSSRAHRGHKRAGDAAAGDTDYMCEVCARSYPCKTTLRYHQRIHTGEKPFQCPMCPKRFRMKNYLQLHINTHTGARPYKCALCPETFKSYSQKHKHKLLVHENLRQHECLICSNKFNRPYDVKLHMKNVHKTEPPRDSDTKSNVKGEKKVGRGVKKVGRGVKKAGSGVKKAGRGVEKVEIGVVKVERGVVKVGRGVKKVESGVKKVGRGVEKVGRAEKKVHRGVKKVGRGEKKMDK